MKLINTIIAHDERSAKYIRLMSEFNRSIQDIEYEPGEDKMWLEKNEDYSYFYYRFNNLKFIIKKEGYHQKIYEEYQEELFNSIRAIPREAFDIIHSIVKEAEDTMGKDIGKFERKNKKMKDDFLSVRNKLPKLSKELFDLENEFLEAYYKANAENIAEYMKKYSTEKKED